MVIESEELREVLRATGDCMGVAINKKTELSDAPVNHQRAAAFVVQATIIHITNAANRQRT
jgi:hypothetical protein